MPRRKWHQPINEHLKIPLEVITGHQLADDRAARLEAKLDAILAHFEIDYGHGTIQA